MKLSPAGRAACPGNLKKAPKSRNGPARTKYTAGQDQVRYDERESVSEETVHNDTYVPARKNRVDIAERFPVFRTIVVRR